MKNETTARFGPSGNPLRFYEEGGKSTVEVMAWLERQGLNAYEYSFGQGVRGKAETFQKIGQEAKLHGIALSIHTPYFISLTNVASETTEKNIGYVRQCIEAAELMCADRLVIHAGGVMKLDRAVALENNKRSLYAILEAVGDTSVQLGVETMGKTNQMGTLEEVIELCSIDSHLYPVVDFGHLNARHLGGYFVTEDDYSRVFEAIDHTLGSEKAQNLHCHFSKIEFTSAGEKRHLTFEDTTFGPDPDPLMSCIARQGLTPRILCESDGTMADDALFMQSRYRAYRNA